MFNKSKKKLQAVEALINTTQQDISSKRTELAKLATGIENCEAETRTLQQSVDQEKKEQEEVEAENARISREIEQATAESKLLKERIEKSKASAAEARAEK